MRIRAYVGASVDGFIAMPDGTPAWGDRFDPRGYGHDDFMGEIDAVVMGRTTFDQALAAFTAAWPWSGKDVYVLTSRPLPAAAPGRVVAWRQGPAALLVHLRSAPLRRDVELLGGARTIQAFRRLRAIDQLQIYILPVLLGDGVRLFPPGSAPLELRLDRRRAFPDGTIELVYSPA